MPLLFGKSGFIIVGIFCEVCGVGLGDPIKGLLENWLPGFGWIEFESGIPRDTDGLGWGPG